MGTASNLSVSGLMCILAGALGSSPLSADVTCKKTDRKIERIDKESREQIEIVKGFDCGSLRVEFLRVNEVAFALMEKKRSGVASVSLGDATLVETHVLQTYRGYRKKYATDYPALVSEEQPYDKEGEGYRTSEIVTIFEPNGFSPEIEYFPAVDEMKELSAGKWPRTIKLFVAVETDTSRYNTKFPTPTLWRSMTKGDIMKLPEMIPLFDESLREPQAFRKLQQMNALNFLSEVSVGDLPEELVRIQGWHSQYDEGCDLGATPIALTDNSERLFLFESVLPELLIDAIFVRNNSPTTVTLHELLGSVSAGTGLRRIDQQGQTQQAISDLESDVVIQPNGSVVIPTAILLRPRELLPCCEYIKRGESNARVAVEGFRKAGYDVTEKHYQTPMYPVYFEILPSYSVSGLGTSLGEVNFERVRPLRLSFSVFHEEGSCPYLMSRTGFDRNSMWTDYGKILHKAETKFLKTTHSEALVGIPSTFRIEEREPEIATIDSVRLTVRFSDGSSETFLPSIPALRNVDGIEVKIGWKSAIEFTFNVRDPQDHRVPENSKLEVNGYYERMDLSRLVHQLAGTRSFSSGPESEASTWCTYSNKSSRAERSNEAISSALWTVVSTPGGANCRGMSSNVWLDPVAPN